MQATFVLAVALLAFSADAARFTLINRCHFMVWPGTLTGGGAADGFPLRPGQEVSVHRPPGWSGRFWGRTGCYFDGAGRGRCETGDCGGLKCRGGGVPPVTLAEFTLNGHGGQDFYDVSLVDGFNLGMSVEPTRGVACGGSCRVSDCRANINAGCPRELRVVAHGAVVACKSACLAFNKPEYCCTGSHNTPHTCPPSRYSRIFKHACPGAYSYAYDDLTSTFTCAAGTNYNIVFCP